MATTLSPSLAAESKELLLCLVSVCCWNYLAVIYDNIQLMMIMMMIKMMMSC